MKHMGSPLNANIATFMDYVTYYENLYLFGRVILCYFDRNHSLIYHLVASTSVMSSSFLRGAPL